MEKSALRRRRKRDLFTLFTGAAFIGFIIFFVVIYSKSKNSEFCLSCHYERPYYENWKTSDHNFVECHKCHLDIPFKMPFITIKYNLGLYDMYPRSNVPSSACLQPGCHDKKKLFSEKLAVKDRPVFNHKQHLSGPLRGVELRCSSCHSHIVQGEKHVTVEKSVCFICHFMGAGKGQSITGCPSCHGTPKKVVEHHGFRFSHQEYLRIGVSCDQCHIEIVKGTGAVEEKKCRQCHVMRKKPNNPKVVHDIHVKQEGIDCYICHSPIEHGNVKLVKTFRVTCKDCHENLHTMQKAMYMGVGGQGVGDLPSRMFAAQVTCEGCHIKENIIGYGKETTKYASGASCVACHEEGYDKMLDDWKKNLSALVKYVGKRVKTAKSLLENSKNEALKKDYALAEHNYNFVKAANGVHNVEYAVKLLKVAVDHLDNMNKKLGKGTPARPKIIATPDGYCTTMCHARLGMPEELLFKEKLVFPHQIHVGKSNIPCMKCHSVERHGVTLLKESDCLKCHHQMEDASEKCVKCHSLERNFYVASVKGFGKGEPNPMVSDVSCTDCHDVTETVSVKYDEVKKNCIECHDGDTSYGEVLDEWKDQVNELANKAKDIYRKATALLQEKKVPKDKEALIRQHYAVILSVKKLFKNPLVAIHNPDYAQSIVEKAEEHYQALLGVVK